MADPKIKERILSLGGVALPGSPEDYGRTIAADTEKWAKGGAVLRRAGELNRSLFPARTRRMHIFFRRAPFMTKLLR